MFFQWHALAQVPLAKGGHKKELDAWPLALVGKEWELLLPLVVCTEADLTSQQVTSPSLRSRWSPTTGNYLIDSKVYKGSMEGSMLRRHRDQLVRGGENADQALDRMIAETRATARQRSSPPDAHAVRRLRPVDEQGSRQGNPEGETQGVNRELGGGDPGQIVTLMGNPKVLDQQLQHRHRLLEETLVKLVEVEEVLKHVTSSLLGPLASLPATATSGQGLLSGGVGQGGEGSSQVNAVWSPEASGIQSGHSCRDCWTEV